MCRIEFALERAVRYLRGEQALEDERRNGKKAIGRVPSFYTSPSSMNLSSLDQSGVSASSNRERQLRPASFDQAESSAAASLSEPSSPVGGSMRRNRSVNIAGAVMTMESAATFGHFTHIDG
jgi:TAG lipase/steryl ester hydrolase/phospholipase A2/LPA acyltransferase